MVAKYDEETPANVYLDDDDCYISVGFSFVVKESIVQQIKEAVEKLPEIIEPDKYEYKFLDVEGIQVLRIGVMYTRPRPHFEGYTAGELSRFLYRQLALRMEG